MRILHLADSHLGFSQYAKLTPEGLNQREQDVFAAFRAAIDHALAKRPDVVVHAGDLFDAVRPTNRAISFAMEQVRRLGDEGIPFVVIAGNHDTPKLRETGSVLRCLEFLPHVAAVFREEPEVHAFGDLAVTAVPQADSQAAYDALLDRARPDPRAKFNVLVAHAGVVGVADFRSGEFNELTITHDRFAGFDYVALGHYHGHIDVSANAAYAGSTEHLSLREAGDRKGVVLADLAARTRTFHPIATRPMELLPPVDATNLAPMELAPRVVEAIRSANPQGKILHLRVRNVPRPAYAAIDHAGIRRASESALHVDLRWELEDAGHAVLQPSEAAGRTLADEFDAYVAGTALTVDRDRLRSLARIVLQEAEAK